MSAMLRRIGESCRGVLMATLLVVNTLLWAVPVYSLILLKLLTPPRSRARNLVSRAMAECAQWWAACDVALYELLTDTRWDIRGSEILRRDAKYLVLCNHQSWNDIFVAMKAFGRKAPFFKFFIKQELIWVPILGLAWWGLDFPFMKRYSKEQIARNPSLRGKDLETTRKACEKYRDLPVTVLNYVEGTRFTPAKHRAQESPYRHLLRPRAGGVAYALHVLGDQLTAILDMTVVYRDGAKSFWDLLCGRMRDVVVEMRVLPVPRELCRGDYERDPAFRAAVRAWIEQIWARKDRRIEALLSGGDDARRDAALSAPAA